MNQRTRLGEDLRQHLFAKIIPCAAAGDDEARRQRQDECRNLADQPVADRQFGIELGAFEQSPVVLDHPDVQPAQDVHEGDHDAGDCIAADEFTGAIHRPVEIRFAADVLAPLPGDGLGDGAGVQVGINRHLLARHRIQRESRRHF
jgi:hypothetical protein